MFKKKDFKRLVTKAVVRGCSVKKWLLKISQNSQKNTCVRASFLISLQKRDPGTGVFLRVLRNFQEYLLSQNTSGGCFCYLDQFEMSDQATFSENVDQIIQNPCDARHFEDERYANS